MGEDFLSDSGTLGIQHWCVSMNLNFSEVRWKKVSFAIGVGVVLVLGACNAYSRWQWSQGACVRYSPDGSEQLLFGKDCNF